MWIRITDIIVKQIEATHLENPVRPDSPMELGLFQRESRSAFHVHTTKKVFPQYYEIPGGGRIPMRKWTGEMKTFAEQETAKVPPLSGGLKITLFGWILFLFALGLIGYAVYETVTLPEQKAAYEQKMNELATVHEGEIYFGRYRVYKVPGDFVGSEGGFGWFKVVRIENDVYQIAKSIEISKTAKPKEKMNSSDFEPETSAVKAKHLEAYTKQFLSEDGLIEFNFDQKKE